MPSNHFKNNKFQIGTLKSMINCQKQGHLCPDSRVRSHCRLVVKERNSPNSARGLTVIRVDLLLYESIPTDKRVQYNWVALKIERVVTTQGSRHKLVNPPVSADPKCPVHVWMESSEVWSQSIQKIQHSCRIALIYQSVYSRTIADWL